uniref:ATP-dependent RNA helicase n=1 Tax=Trichuris muris TaxID=70415 RepID=A0A5S6QC74_TRIMR
MTLCQRTGFQRKPYRKLHWCAVEMSSNGENPVIHYDDSNSSLPKRSTAVPLEDNVAAQENLQYFSGANFEDFRLRSALLEGLYNYPLLKPSRVQDAVLNVLMNRGPLDMIVQSHSGSGKTIAFALCMLQRVDAKLRLPQCVCLTPTHELAVEVGVLIERIGTFMEDVSVCYAIPEDETQAARVGLITDQIVVGTPGTLAHWAFHSSRLDLASIRMLVVDEADVMVDLRCLGTQTFAITDALRPFCQRLLFSTTITDRTVRFARRITRNPVVIRLRDDEMNLKNIHQFFLSCANDEDAFDLTVRLCDAMEGRCMIFCVTKRNASALADHMRSLGHRVSVVTADLGHLERAKLIRDFRHQHFKLLITTNVCSRGIDIPGVEMIVNCHVPLFPDHSPDFNSYMHRIGRGGRFGQKSVAVTLAVGAREVGALESIERRSWFVLGWKKTQVVLCRAFSDNRIFVYRVPLLLLLNTATSTISSIATSASDIVIKDGRIHNGDRVGSENSLD